MNNITLAKKSGTRVGLSTQDTRTLVNDNASMLQMQ